MAMETAHETEYKVRDLSTRSVTLFPTRAQIVRVIKDVALKPGVNEVTISGLSPTVDENSIKVEGTGSATISNIAVESRPNRELYEDVYPESEEDETDESDDDKDNNSDMDLHDDPELRAASDNLFKLEDDMKRIDDAIQSAEARLNILDAHGKRLSRKKGVDIEESLETYKQERKKAFDDKTSAVVQQREVNYATISVRKTFDRLWKQAQKKKDKAAKQTDRVEKRRAKERERLVKRKAERARERERIRVQRQSFWPKYCYSVSITLETGALTPISSRRTSFSNDIDMAGSSSTNTIDKDEPPKCDIILSYVTTSAYWSPHYDLQLSTTNSTASLCFDARLNNSTSETWENCKITLSTSQATFSGIEERIPSLVPWHIKLAGKGGPTSPDDTSVFKSAEEQRERQKYLSQQQGGTVPKARATMFGIDKGPVNNIHQMAPQMPNKNHELQDYQMQLMLLEQQNMRRVMMARREAMPVGEEEVASHNQHVQEALQALKQQQQGMMKSLAPKHQQMLQQQKLEQQEQQQLQQMQQMQPQQMQPQKMQPQQMQPQQMQPQQMQPQQMQPQQMQMQQMQMQPPPQSQMGPQSRGDVLTEFDFDAFLQDEGPGLEYQESLVEETGLTTTYDLPGLKTLVPRRTASKQRVARINFSQVHFHHTVVAKYQPVAYLKAKLRNNSKLTLLKGTAGLTLDGSFLGQTNLPRCSPGDAFGLSLGVDPAIRVMYAQPEVRRTTTGVFTKEDSSVYVRAVTVHNTRGTAGKPVSLFILDQIPVSEDERLRVDLLSPRGLTPDGAGVSAGAPGRELKEDQDWGKAEAHLKNNGEMRWDVTLKAGKMVKLGLEYSVSMPAGEAASQC